MKYSFLKAWMAFLLPFSVAGQALDQKQLPYHPHSVSYPQIQGGTNHTHPPHGKALPSLPTRSQILPQEINFEDVRPSAPPLLPEEENLFFGRQQSDMGQSAFPCTWSGRPQGEWLNQLSQPSQILQAQVNRPPVPRKVFTKPMHQGHLIHSSSDPVAVCQALGFDTYVKDSIIFKSKNLLTKVRMVTLLDQVAPVLSEKKRKKYLAKIECVNLQGAEKSEFYFQLNKERERRKEAERIKQLRSEAERILKQSKYHFQAKDLLKLHNNHQLEMIRHLVTHKYGKKGAIDLSFLATLHTPIHAKALQLLVEDRRPLQFDLIAPLDRPQQIRILDIYLKKGYSVGNDKKRWVNLEGIGSLTTDMHVKLFELLAKSDAKINFADILDF